MNSIPLRVQKPIITIIVLQLISCIWYLLPSMSNAHIPEGFIKMMIFGGTALVVIVITTILCFINKPSGLLWKLPVVFFMSTLLTGCFYNNYKERD